MLGTMTPPVSVRCWINHRSWCASSRSRVAASLALAAPGIPVLFRGQEFSEDKLWSDNRGYNGLIWWEGLTAADPSMSDYLQFMSDLIQVRRSQPALRASGVRVSPAVHYDRVIVLHRWVAGQ
jgi:1,4-alpha-glucan branching enzyme